MRNDSPMQRAQILWRELLYPEQPAGWNIVGRKETIQRLSRQDLLSYMRLQYAAQNTVVCLAGALPKDAQKMVATKFHGISATKPRTKPRVVESQTAPALLCEEKQTDQTHLCLGVRAYSLLYPKRYAQELLAVILGGMMSSRMFVEIREKQGLAYYISTENEAEPDNGYLVTVAGVKNEAREKAIATILKEYKKMAAARISLQEIQKAKDNVKGKMALLLEQSDAQASFYGLQELLEKKTLSPEEIYDKINAVSRDDVLELARDIFRPPGLNLAIVGPELNKKQMQSLLSI